MKYSIEISDGKVIEKFEFKGKEYTKTWEETPKGLKLECAGLDGRKRTTENYRMASSSGTVLPRKEQIMTDRIKDRAGCPYRHANNGNCLICGGFCFAVHDKYCQFIKEAQANLPQYRPENWITMEENEVLVKTSEEAIETIKANVPTSGYQMLRESLNMAISALEEIQQYRDIGTVEECREAVEKQKPKKPLGGVDIAGNEYMICPYCSAIVEDGEWRADYCPDCGQSIRWDENLEEKEDERD